MSDLNVYNLDRVELVDKHTSINGNLVSVITPGVYGVVAMYAQNYGVTVSTNGGTHYIPWSNIKIARKVAG